MMMKTKLLYQKDGRIYVLLLQLMSRARIILYLSMSFLNQTMKTYSYSNYLIYYAIKRKEKLVNFASTTLAEWKL